MASSRINKGQTSVSGALQEAETKIEIRVGKQLNTSLDAVISLAVSSDGYIWISNKGHLQKVKSEGSIIFKCVSLYEVQSETLAATPDGELVLACNGYALKKFKEQTVQCQNFKNNRIPFVINCVYVTDDNTILMGSTFISLHRSDKHTQVKAILVVDGKTRQEKVFAYDKKRERIFRYVKSITTSQNRNIFVVDVFPTDLLGRVVILDSDGYVINIYGGGKKENTKETAFKPSAIVTTPNDNIIVSDVNTHSLHVLNNYGHLVNLVNLENIGITYPTSLGFYSSGRLYIGCAREVGDDNLFEVCISGC